MQRGLESVDSRCGEEGVAASQLLHPLRLARVGRRETWDSRHQLSACTSSGASCTSSGASCTRSGASCTRSVASCTTSLGAG